MAYSELQAATVASSSAVANPTLTATLGSGTTAGSTIIALVACRTGGTVPTLAFTDSASNTYTIEQATTEQATNNTWFAVFVLQNAGAGITSLKATASGLGAQTATLLISYAEIGGQPTGGSLDGAASTGALATGPHTLNLAAPSAGTDLAIGFVANQNGTLSGLSVTGSSQGSTTGVCSVSGRVIDGAGLCWGFNPTSGSAAVLSATNTTSAGTGGGFLLQQAAGFSLAQSPSNSIAAAATSSALTVAKPTQGQLLVCGIGLAGTAVPVASVTDNGSAGWTQFPNSPFTFAGTDDIVAWFYKVASATDAASLTTVTFSWTNGSTVTFGSCWMDEYHGFIGTPTLDLCPSAQNVPGSTTVTITGGVEARAVELALGFVGIQNYGAATGANTYSPDNGTTTYPWNSTHSAGTDFAIRTWAAPTTTPATASKWIMTWTTAHGAGALGATFYDYVAATASGAITFSASATVAAQPSPSGAVSLSGSATDVAQPTGSGAVALSASTAAAGRSPGSGSTSLSASATGAAVSPGIAAVALSASTAATGQSPGSGSVALNGSGTSSAQPTGTASLSLSATSSDIASVTGSGSLGLSASATVVVVSSGTAAVSLSGSATVDAAVAPAGAVTLSASGVNSARATPSGSISLLATVVQPVVPVVVFDAQSRPLVVIAQSRQTVFVAIERTLTMDAQARAIDFDAQPRPLEFSGGPT